MTKTTTTSQSQHDNFLKETKSACHLRRTDKKGFLAYKKKNKNKSAFELNSAVFFFSWQF